MRHCLIFPAAALALACVAERGPLTNRMAQASTSYLTRAARQPVGWQPWSREAFALAARLDRPLLLYIGAEDCVWCARMDRESYTDAAIGALIDSLFVPVRVDRDERPDVARRYQAALQSLAGLRGYPVTVFLTPDGSPFFGGTYFPNDDPVTGRGLRQILPEVARSYRDQRETVWRQAALVRQLATAKTAVSHGVLREDVVAAEIRRVRTALERALEAPEGLWSFPYAQAVTLLLDEHARSGDTVALRLARAAIAVLGDAAETPGGAGSGLAEASPEPVRALLLRNLAAGWRVTEDSGYREAGRRLGRALARRLARDEGARFADRDGFVIAAVIEAAPALGDTAAAAAARDALDRLVDRVYEPGQGARHAVVGSVTGLLQDQVQLAAACLAAFGTFRDRTHLDIARDIAEVLEREFADPLGGYFDSVHPDPAAPALADRTKQVFDDLLPGANAWAARALFRLTDATGEARYAQRADATLGAFAGALRGEGVRAASYLLVAREALGRR